MEERLKQLLLDVSDSYPDFVSGTIGFAKDYDILDEMVSFIEASPQADSSEITWHLVNASGMKPIEQ